MKILFDQGTPAPLRRWFVGDEVATANEMGWSDLSNGRLLEAAEGSAFQMLVTTDQNLKHEQNLTGRVIAILVCRPPVGRRFGGMPASSLKWLAPSPRVLA
jgi:hypothetical protein